MQDFCDLINTTQKIFVQFSCQISKPPLQYKNLWY